MLLNKVNDQLALIDHLLIINTNQLKQIIDDDYTSNKGIT